MKPTHSFVKSEIYVLVKTVEFDVEIGDDGFRLRIELFCSEKNGNDFRAHIWRSEFYRIQSAFPQDIKTHEPVDAPSDEMILVDFSYQLSGKYSQFYAENERAALQIILDDIQRSFEHISD